MAWLQQGEDMLNELLKFPGEDKSDEKLLMTVKMQKNMETQLSTLAWLVTESERLLGGEDFLSGACMNPGTSNLGSLLILLISLQQEPTLVDVSWLA